MKHNMNTTKKLMTLLLAMLALATSAQDGNDYLQRGVRCIADVNAHIGFDDAKDIYLFGASITPGYQLNRFLFVGGGIAPTLVYYTHKKEDIYSKEERTTELASPFYGAIRYDLTNAKVSPFVEGRAGISLISDVGGGYFYAGAGCRIKRVNISAGYTCVGSVKSHTDTFQFVGLRMGYEF